MNEFKKVFVTKKEHIDETMHFAIGASWDNLPDSKYPDSFPAVLVVSRRKDFCYVYTNDFTIISPTPHL